MSKTETETEKAYADNVRIRGEHGMVKCNPGSNEVFPGLRLGHAGGMDYLLELREFGGNSHNSGAVEVQREELPKLIEELIKRAYPRDSAQLQEFIERGLDELEQRSGEEAIYENE